MRTFSFCLMMTVHVLAFYFIFYVVYIIISNLVILSKCYTFSPLIFCTSPPRDLHQVPRLPLNWTSHGCPRRVVQTSPYPGCRLQTRGDLTVSTIMCMRLNGSVLPPPIFRKSTMRASPNVSTVLRDAGIGAERV